MLTWLLILNFVEGFDFITVSFASYYISLHTLYAPQHTEIPYSQSQLHVHCEALRQQLQEYHSHLENSMCA